MKEDKCRELEVRTPVMENDKETPVKKLDMNLEPVHPHISCLNSEHASVEKHSVYGYGEESIKEVEEMNGNQACRGLSREKARKRRKLKAHKVKYNTTDFIVGQDLTLERVEAL